MSNCRFERNFAGNTGSAIQKDNWKDSYFSAINCSFMNHDSRSRTISVINSTFINCSFINNHADFDGGAIYTGVMSYFYNCHFENNSAEYGGAIYLYACNSSIIDCNFLNNSAKMNGGAIFCWRSDCFIIEMSKFVNSSVGSNTINSSVVNCTFINSNNEAGGFIDKCYFINSTTRCNGVITDCNFLNNSGVSVEVEQNDVRISQDCSVVNCSFVNSHCGPVRIISNCSFVNKTKGSSSVVHLMGICNVVNCSFIDNDCRAIIANGKGLNCSIINCLFVNNADSGAIYIYGGNSSITDSIFINNGAINNWSYVDGGGGAILLVNSNTTINNCTFINNSNINSEGIGFNHGGAIAIVSLYLKFAYCSVFNSSFINNTARNGGAIYCSGICSVNSCNFSSNSAVGYYNFNGHTEYNYVSCGGAIYFSHCWDYMDASVVNSNFVDNFAEGFGSAIYTQIDKVDVSDSNFSNNIAKGNVNTYYSVFDTYLSKNYGNSTIIVESIGKENILTLKNCFELIDNDDKFKTKILIDSSAVSTTYLDETYLTVTLKDFKGNILKNTEITIKVNGKTYNKTTDNKGQVKLLINFIPGKYNSIITYAGDNFNLKASKNVNIAVKKGTPKFSSAVSTYLDETYLTVTLKDFKDNILKNTEITIKVMEKHIIKLLTIKAK